MAMTFKKPTNVRYVQMCIYVDNTMKDWEPNTNPLTVEQEETIYMYIYHLYYNIACRKKFFGRFDQYDEYALWCATKAFTRMLDVRQLTGEMERIRSILNYVKATAYGWKTKWEAENYQTIFSDKYTKGFDSITFKQEYQSTIRNTHRDRMIDDVYEDINLIPTLLKEIVYTSPHANDKITASHLYKSCLLTLLADMDGTVTCRSIEKYAHKYKTNNVVLWGLSKDMENIVALMVNRLKVQLADSITSSMKKYDITAEEADTLFVRNVVNTENNNE